MKIWPLFLPLVPLLFACSSQDEPSDPAGAYFPVKSFLQSQVKHIDTSLYRLLKVVKKDGHTDTTIISREQFHQEASDFLNIEDIAASKWRDDYTESRLYDDALKRAVLSYTPKNKQAPILRQDITIAPGAGGDDAVKTIFINRLMATTDSTVHKKLLWEVGQRLQVATTVSRQGRPDENRTVEVWWGLNASAE